MVDPEIASTSWSSLSLFSGSLFPFKTVIPTSSPDELKTFSLIKLSLNQSFVISAPRPAVSPLWSKETPLTVLKSLFNE